MKEFEEYRDMLFKSSRERQKPLSIVLTGCSSGIGLHASKLLKASTPESKLFLVARNLEKAIETKDKVDYSIPGGDLSLDKNIIPMTCDHTSLQSVRNFCNSLRKELVNNNLAGIDVLCLNAAILLGEDAKAEMTEDNVEVTFQTNHLAPFLIANLLFDLINPGGRVVVTTSGLHAFCSFEDFNGVLIDEKTGYAIKGFEMVNGQQFNHKQSYSASKLCNVAFGLALKRRLQRKNATAICFTPGLIPSSGLFRHQKNWVETVLKKQAVGMDDTVEWGGCMLAWMILSEKAIIEEPENKEGMYWRTTFGISKRDGSIPRDLFLAPVNDEANDPENQERLWKISIELAGIH